MSHFFLLSLNVKKINKNTADRAQAQGQGEAAAAKAESLADRNDEQAAG